jgi:hypothetical protein
MLYSEQLLISFQTLIARFAKETSFWLKFHRNAAYLATTTTIPLAATAFGLTNSAPTTSHHSLGFAMCGVIIVTLVSGYIAQWWMQHSVGTWMFTFPSVQNSTHSISIFFFDSLKQDWARSPSLHWLLR